LTEFHPLSPSPKSALVSPTTGGLRSDHDFKRQGNFLDKAEKCGHRVIRGEVDEEKRRMGISLVIMKNGMKGDDGGLMEQEIFGPVLPIIPVDVSCCQPREFR
jgi:acyl-CoA reductase-like NAD-dependent aldehyde dehydrogenase